jgi:vacuolar-type H+-ATPase subunit H
MTTQNDPISQIKTAEQELKKKIEQAKIDFDKKVIEHGEDLEIKTAAFKSDLREKGMEKLGTTKKEAGELFKSKMATAESEKNQVSSEAKSKLGEATKEIVSAFLNHVKN